MRPQDIAQIKETVVSVIAAMKGDFDTEVKNLKEATAAWDKRNNLDKESARIASENAELENAKKKVDYEAEQHEIRLQGMQDALEKKEKAVVVREKAATAKETALSNGISQLAADRETFQRNVEVMNADLTAKLTAVQEQLDALTEREALVGARETKVKQALKVAETLVQ